ncbi:TPA: hypothetical protein HA317_04335 [Candidatus Woesearchaeota archaeon]|nr:hypothetical protein [Candidatus Woesearchaeota archaeon]
MKIIVLRAVMSALIAKPLRALKNVLRSAISLLRKKIGSKEKNAIVCVRRRLYSIAMESLRILLVYIHIICVKEVVRECPAISMYALMLMGQL